MRLIALLMTTALLFAGCTNEPEPKEPDATSKPTPTATVPSMPAEAKEGSDEGAIAFVKHYIEVFNYASNTGDVEELQKLSDSDCGGCTEYIDLFRKTYADGGYFKDSDWQLNTITAEAQGSEMVVFAHLSAPKGRYKTSTKSTERAGEGESTDVTLVPAPTSSGWILTQFGFQAEDSS